MFRKLSILLLVVASLIWSPVVALAQVNPDQSSNQFSTSYDVTYDVGTDGMTDVTEKITLQNLTAKYFASKYSLIIGSTNITEVSAKDEQSPLEVTTTPQGTKTQIDIKLGEQIAGQGKEQSFTLHYKSKDFAQQIGKTWEVDIPKAPATQGLETYNVQLLVPIEFGDPTSITPLPRTQSSNLSKLTLTYTKDELTNSGVSANFGSFQIFDFRLTYRLQGQSLFPALKGLPLPANSQYQEVALYQLTPKPINVTIDNDGNYIAWYRVTHGDNFLVQVQGSAKIYAGDRQDSASLLLNKDQSEEIKADKYWEKDNPLIKEKLTEIFKNGVPSPTKDKEYLIYRYVADTLKFDVTRAHQNGERLGAVTALNNPTTAVDQEFADLFVALSRAADVPAREIDGYAYSNNQTLRPLSLYNQSLHAWAEYYDQSKGWVMVDPTWDSTTGGVDYFHKFDLNHFSLLTRGVNSQLNFPVEQVQVHLNNGDFHSTVQIQPSLQMRERIWAGLPYHALVKVVNSGSEVSPPMPLSFASGQLSVLGNNTLIVPPLPPFGSTDYTFDFRTTNFTKEYQETVEVTVGSQKIVKAVTVTSLFGILSYPVLIGIIGLLSAWIYFGTLGFHFHRIRSGRK